MMRSGDATCKKDCVEWGESVYRFCIFLNWGICVIGFQGNPETAVYPFKDHGTDRLGMWILKDWEHPIHLAKVEAIHWAETCVPQRPQCVIFWDPFFKKNFLLSGDFSRTFFSYRFIIRLTEAILYRRAYRPCIFLWNLEKGVRGIGCSIIGNAYSWGFFIFIFFKK